MPTDSDETNRALVRFVGEIKLDDIPDPGTQAELAQLVQSEIGHTGAVVVRVDDWDWL
jgi:hypothetical protein